MYGEILEEEMVRESVFKDQSKLSPDYVPKELVHRDEEFRKLSRLFRAVLENRASQRILVTGSVGVGKTALTLKFGQQLEPAAKKRNFRLDYIHINCRKQKTPYTVLRQMIDHYNPRLPPRGFSPEELLGMVIDWLDKHDAYLTLTLDELGFFIQQNGPDLLYSLTRVAEESGAPNRLSIIAISRDQNFLRLLDPATQSTFMHNLVELDKYNARQLADILTQRIREAFKADKVEEDAVSLIADIAARWGDARFALELLLHAGMFADEKKAKKVTPEYARQAKAEVHPEVRKEVLAELQLHERLLLLALARRLKITERAYALTGEVEEAYEVVCEEHGEEPRKHTQLWGYLKHMDGLGLVDTRPSGRPHRGRSKRISVPDVPVSMLEKELEKLLKRKN